MWLLAGGLLLAKLVFSLNISWQIFNFAFQVDESESMIVAETVLMSRGTNIYATPGPDLFVSAPYTPLYYLLNWPFIQLFGASFKPGRLISFGAACAIGWLVYRFVHDYSTARPAGRPDPKAAIVATLAWASLGLPAFWGITVKPDMLALALSLAGLYLILIENRKSKIENRKSKTQSSVLPLMDYTSRSSQSSVLSPQSSVLSLKTQNYYLYAAAGLFALAALTKQTAFAGILAALVWLLMQPGNGPKLALRLGIVYGLLAFGPMLILNWLSQGGFWYHIVTVHELPWSSQNYTKFFWGLVQSYQLFGVLALVLVGFWLWDVLGLRPFALKNSWHEFRRNPGTLILLYCGTAWGAGLSTGTFGGNHNHLLELCAAGCVALGATLVRVGELWQTNARRLGQRVGLGLALILIIWQGLGLFVGEARIKPENFPVLGSFGPTRAGLDGLRGQFFNEDWLGLEYRAPLESQKKRLGEVAAFMTNEVGPFIYSDNISLMLASGKPLFTTDPFTQTHATRYGRWNQGKLLEMTANQQFSLIVLRRPIEPGSQAEAGETGSDIYVSPELARLIAQNYRLACRDIAYIYVPKARADFKGC